MKQLVRFLTILVLLGGLLLPVLPLSGISSPPVPDALAEEPGGMPGWPVPAKPIPYHEPGHLSRAGSYATQVLRANEMGVQEPVEISGLDAMVADGLDPLAGNYTLVDWDSIFWASSQNDQFNVATLTVDETPDPPVIDTIPGSEKNLGGYPYNDVAAADLNNDGQTEQIVSWLGSTNRIFMSIGEMPGSLGRTTSAPAAISHGTTPPDGWSLEFDGVDDYVNAGTGINLANASFTVAFWARRDTINTDDFAVGHGEGGTNNGLHLGFLGSNNRFRCSFHSNDLDTSAAYTDNAWHYWACTYDAVTKRRTIYRDGLEVAQDISTSDYLGAGELDIGRYLASTRSFDGLIDQVGIWSAAHTHEQIAQDMVRSTPVVTDLVAYWPFDEGSGTTAADISGNGNNGTLVNGPIWNPENAPQGELGEIHLLVRGYDEALWHCNYDPDSGGCLNWDNLAGGTLLSAPAAASLEPGQFDAFVIGTDNQVYRHHWEGDWIGGWQLYADWPHDPPAWTGPIPELPPPAVVARDGGFDLFRVGPDNTLRWHDGTGWQSLGGMLASAPGAVSLAADHMQVFARGVDEALWYLTYSSGSWGAWQRLELAGLDEGVTIASAPVAVSPAPGQIEVYVRGSDDQVWKLAFDGSAWDPWVSLGGPVASGLAIAGGNIFAQAEPGSLQTSNGGAWLDIGGLTPWHVFYDTGLTGNAKAMGAFQDFSIRLESAYFWGAGRSQIALAYFSSPSRVSIAVFEIGEGFVPDGDSVLQLELPEDIDYFSMTTGDFLDGDGTDEIALAYVRGNTYGLKIIDVTPEGLSVEPIGGETETVTIPDEDCDDYSYGYFTGTLDITGGDFDGDGQDEIALSTVWHNPDWIDLPDCDSWLYSIRMRVYDLLKNQTTGVHSLHTYYVGPGEGKCKLEGAWWGEAIYDDPNPDRPAEIIGVAVAAGDTDGDGKDELLRTWPVRFDTYADSCYLYDDPVTLRFVRDLQVLELPDNDDKYTNTWAGDDGIITNTTPSKIDERMWTYSYQDRLAVGDLNRDLKREIVWLMTDELRTYHYVHDPEQTPYWEAVTANKALTAMKYPKLVTGGFTGEGLRVGPPNYRRQYSVGRIAAIINAPPKHVDVLNGVEYNINADDPDTKAELTLAEGKTTHVSLTTKRDWGLSTTFATAIGDQEGTHTNNSLTTTYGENFSTETGYETTFEIQEKSAASEDDALLYIRTDYDVWEYPVLVDPTGTAADYLSVVFPASAPRLRVDRGNTCDSWYQPRHQLDNVWSYPSKAEQLVDRDEAGSGDLVTSSDYLVSDDYRSFTVNWGTDNVTKQTSGFELGLSHEFEWQIGGDELSFEIEGIGFSTRLPSFKFSSKAEYNYAQLAEWEVKTTNDTEVYGYLNGVPGAADAGYDYAVWPYLYWAKDGYLMLDYTTSPEGTFWTRYDKPDPAFTLPWASGQCNTADDPQTEAFTRDILVDPPVVSAGEPVTVTATVRNFSQQPNTKAFNVTFYLGDPGAGGTQIGAPQTIGAYALGPRAVKTVTTHWTATGKGDQRIYAVIDPTNQLAEVHDETDPYVNNNKGYGLVHMGAIDFVDMGEAADRIYYPITYGLNPTMMASLFVPVGNLAENTRFDFRDSDLAVPGIAGKAFELLVYRGEDNWDTPEQDYFFRTDTDHPPAVMILSYGDADIAGMDEANLTLYRLGLNGWEVATCPNYDVQRFPVENLLAVPLCRASTFALSDETPQQELDIYLPLITRNLP